jgi:hypothetical protein
MSYPTETEARLALESVRRGRQQVVEEIGMPWWYWWGLAAAWVVLGLLANFNAPWWIVTVATVAVGAAHATVSHRVLAGRQRTGDVRVCGDVAGERGMLLVIGFLLVLVGVTIAVALGLDADGAGHPSIWASCFTAVLVVLGGPRLMLAIRDDAARRAVAE